MMASLAQSNQLQFKQQQYREFNVTTTYIFVFLPYSLFNIF